VKASILQPDGSYRKAELKDEERFNAQLTFCQEAKELASAETDTGNKRVFVPKMHHE
jgi:hypothetical protein